MMTRFHYKNKKKNNNNENEEKKIAQQKKKLLKKSNQIPQVIYYNCRDGWLFERMDGQTKVF